MKRDVVNYNFKSSFLSCDKDTEEILKQLFMLNKPHSEILKRLLVINTKDCIENNSATIGKLMKEMSVAELIKQGYIRLAPKLLMPEHEEVKAYIIISFDNFSPNDGNDYFRDCNVTFDIICHTDFWQLEDFKIRPLQIAGYIDGILNNTKLSGIGIFTFLNCNELVLNEELAGYSLTYRAVHGNDDRIPAE